MVARQMERLIVRKSLLFVALVAACAGIPACGSANQPPASPTPTVSVAPVNDQKFAQALLRVISDGGTSPERQSVLASVVRFQFARSAQRFASGHPERGLDALKGALFLLRSGELTLDMLDPNAARALQGGHYAVAPLGLEGPALAFLHMQSKALPALHPDQARIRQNVDALEAWMVDTRKRSSVENASANARAFGEQSILEPSSESLERARIATEQWLSESHAFNRRFRPGMGTRNRDEVIEAYRALRSGAIILAGLYLRHGDAQAAAEALESPNVERIASREFIERLQTAASSDDPETWLDLAALYSSSASKGDEDELAMPAGIAEGAAWGAALAAYRSDPTQLSTAIPLSVLLVQYGMAEGAPLVLTAAAKIEARVDSEPESKPKSKPESKLGSKPDIDRIVGSETFSRILRLLAQFLVHEDTARDYQSVQRMIALSQELLSIADSVQASTQLDPSPARLRAMMASLLARSGNLVAARPMLEQSLSDMPTLDGYSTLARLLLQAGDHAGALSAVKQGLRSPDAAEAPWQRAEAHLLAFQVQRARGAQKEGRDALAAALNDALIAREAAQNDYGHALADRILARLAYYFDDVKAWQRAIDRMLERASVDERVLSMVIIEATATGLLFGDIRTVRRVFDDTVDRADTDDAVYASLWLLLTEQLAGEASNGAAKPVLSNVGLGSGWLYHLAKHGLGETNDAAFRAKATGVMETAEADFYIAMKKRVRKDANAEQALKAVADGVATDLVETYLARELTVSGSWGPSPSPLP